MGFCRPQTSWTQMSFSISCGTLACWRRWRFAELDSLSDALLKTSLAGKYEKTYSCMNFCWLMFSWRLWFCDCIHQVQDHSEGEGKGSCGFEWRWEKEEHRSADTPRQVQKGVADWEDQGEWPLTSCFIASQLIVTFFCLWGYKGRLTHEHFLSCLCTCYVWLY